MKRTEEQQKDYIFAIFSKCRNETVSGRMQVYYSVLYGEIYIWYRDYLSLDVDGIGLAIGEVIQRFLKDEKINKIPENKDGFLKYLNKSIKREIAGIYHKYNNHEIIKIPKEIKRKLRDIEDFIRMKESQLGRKLTSEEKMLGVSRWFKNPQYVELLNSMNVGGLSYTNNDGSAETDVLNYYPSSSSDPLSEYNDKIDMETIRDSVKSLLEKKQARSRDCYRALFTLHCIEKIKDFNRLYPVLDWKILENWQKNGKKPKQYKIYQKYHPKAQKSSAEAMASKNLSDFLNDLKMLIKSKYS